MNGIDTYAYNADLYCSTCANGVIQANLQDKLGYSDNGDSDCWPQYVGDSGGGEADSPQHCGNCSMFLENPLTSDGENYLKEMIAEGSTNGIQDLIHAEWKQYYNYLFV